MPKLLYQEIRKQIFKTIKEKKLQKGDLLPSEWEFVSLLKTSRPTIRKALNELSEMGIVESIRGKGTVLITNNLSQVAEGRTYELALFFVDDEELYNKPSSIFNIVNGITREVVCSGHKITLNRFTHDSLSAGEVPKEEALKADGFLTLWLWKKEFLQTLIATGKPVVMIDSLEMKNITAVNVDNERGAELITKHLISLGHTKTAYVGSGQPAEGKIQLEPYFTSTERFNGHRKAMLDAGYISNLKYYESKPGYEYTLKLGKKIAEENKVTAIFAFDDTMCDGIIDGIKSAGKRVPEDISVAGFGNEPHSKYNEILTTIKTDFFAFGRLSVKRLLEQLTEKTNIITRSIVPVELLIKKTTAQLHSK